MEKMFTQKLLCLEKEAQKWFEFFDNIPDENFTKCNSSVDFAATKVKAYARAYHNFMIDGRETDFIIN